MSEKKGKNFETIIFKYYKIDNRKNKIQKYENNNKEQITHLMTRLQDLGWFGCFVSKKCY